MLNWISNVVGDVTEWLGSGIASLIDWLLGGIVEIFTIVVDAADGIFGVFESLWSLATSFVDSLSAIFYSLCPFVPEPVLGVITSGLIAVVIAGIVKKVRGS